MALCPDDHDVWYVRPDIGPKNQPNIGSHTWTVLDLNQTGLLQPGCAWYTAIVRLHIALSICRTSENARVRLNILL